MKRRFVILLILLCGLVSFTSAQDYYFGIPKYTVDVYIQKDASIDIDYNITFAPVRDSHSVDIVDIGFPTTAYKLNSISASVDGHEIPRSSIKTSTYIDIGVEIHLGSHTIMPGDQGTLFVHGNNPKMVFQDKKKNDYASVEFVPTWFGSKYVSGYTKLTINIHFPAGVGPDETIYHYYEFTNTFRDNLNRITFSWEWDNARMSDQYRVGVSFPKKYVDRIYKKSAGVHFKKFFSGLFGFLCNPCMFIFYFVGFAVGIGIWSSKFRMKKYLPPSLKVEGVGIKRGLTAVEAAILGEMPLNKVTSMIIFGLVKKKGIKIKTFKPLNLSKTNIKHPWYDYEEDFLKAIKEKTGKLNKTELKDLMVKLIKKVAKKLKGFNLSMTRKYYKSIVSNAWQLVRKANIPQIQSETINRNLEWLLMDKHFDDKFKNIPFENIYVPSYWYHHIPYRGGGQSTGDMVKFPSLDFANDFVKGFQVMSDNIVSDVQGLFSGVTKVTNPPPKPSSGGYSSSGGGCACACACAGCACACAGGGR